MALPNLPPGPTENARLYDRQQESVRRLAAAEESLSVQLGAVTDVHALQRALIGQLLDGGGLVALVRTVAEQVGGEVGVFSPRVEAGASYPGTAGTGKTPRAPRRP